jgi:predicted HicB family RNase H-like nuclease
MRTRKATDTIQLKLRFSEALRRRLKRAKSDGRSLNSEIVHRLEQSFWPQERLSERLRRRLEQAAKHNGWSMNAEIWNRLDVSFQREDQKEVFEKALRDAVQAQEGVTRKQFAAELSQMIAVRDAVQMIEKVARDAVQAQEEVTRKLFAAELSKSKHESPPKGEDSK